MWPNGVAFEPDLQEDVDDFIDPSDRIQVYRIAQEAVTNVMKHANASRLGVRLMRAGDSVWLAVRDDGIGFEHTGRKPKHGFGILSMTERANMVKGTLAVVSRPGAGTLVTLQMSARR
ncbi:MAG: sensor histidine kinase [Spirochaetota bacterium]